MQCFLSLLGVEMFRLEVDWGYFVVRHISNISYGRPQFDYTELHSAIILDKIHKWFIENNIFYNLEYITDFSKLSDDACEQYFIDFENKDDATLFKLTWGGNII